MDDEQVGGWMMGRWVDRWVDGLLTAQLLNSDEPLCWTCPWTVGPAFSRRAASGLRVGGHLLSHPTVPSQGWRPPALPTTSPVWGPTLVLGRVDAALQAPVGTAAGHLADVEVVRAGVGLGAGEGEQESRPGSGLVCVCVCLTMLRFSTSTKTSIPAGGRWSNV